MKKAALAIDESAACFIGDSARIEMGDTGLEPGTSGV